MDPNLGSRSLASTKHHINKRQRMISIQSIKWRHTNGHVMCSVVVILSQMQPLQPCSLLPTDIVTQVALQPLVNYLRLSIHLWVITGTRCQLRPHQPEKLLPKSAHEAAVPVTDDGLTKCAYFVSRSTTTKIQSLPCTMGNPVMKSIDMLSHFPSGMGRGYNNPRDGSSPPYSSDKHRTP